MIQFDPALANALAGESHPETALADVLIDPIEVVWEDDEHYYVYED